MDRNSPMNNAQHLQKNVRIEYFGIRIYREVKCNYRCTCLTAPRGYSKHESISIEAACYSNCEFCLSISNRRFKAWVVELFLILLFGLGSALSNCMHFRLNAYKY